MASPLQPPQFLTPEVIRCTTGKEDISQLEELEIIFTTVNELSSLDQCRGLRSLTLIDTGLWRISGLQPVGRSLLRLCLCEQGLKRIEGLSALGQLRELFLYQNAISKIEGLDGCPRLQRLWLFGNRLISLEGLHPCGNLRELCVQENAISSLLDLGRLPHLKTLALAGNPIGGDPTSDAAAFAALARLPSLADLSLDDAHFGTCPLAGSGNSGGSGSGGSSGSGGGVYRMAAVAALPRLQRLDGIEVNGEERTRASASRAERELRFSATLDALREERDRVVWRAELRRQRANGRAQALRGDLSSALAALEQAVSEGRKAVAAAADERVRIERDSMAALEADVAEEKAALAREASAVVAAERSRAAEEERLLALLEARQDLEQRHFALTSALQSSCRDNGCSVDGGGGCSGGVVACHELSEQLPEWQYLQDLMRLRQLPSATSRWKIVRAVRLYGPQLCDVTAPMWTASPFGSSETAVLPVGTAFGCPRGSPFDALFLCASEDVSASICRWGFGALGARPVALFSDPRTALTASDGQQANGLVVVAPSEGTAAAGSMAVPEQHLTGSESAAAMLVVVRVASSGSERRVTVPRPPASAASLSALISEHDDAAGSLFTRISYFDDSGPPEGSGGSGGYIVLVPPSCFSRCVPEYHMQCARGAVADAPRKLEAALEALSASQACAVSDGSMVEAARQRLAAHVRRHEERVAAAASPALAERLMLAGAEVRRRKEEVAELRRRVDAERSARAKIIVV